MKQYLSYSGLQYLWQKIKQIFVSKSELEDVELVVSAALNDLESRKANTTEVPVVNVTDRTISVEEGTINIPEVSANSDNFTLNGHNFSLDTSDASKEISPYFGLVPYNKLRFVHLNQTEYDSLSYKNPNILYIIDNSLSSNREAIRMYTHNLSRYNDNIDSIYINCNNLNEKIQLDLDYPILLTYDYGPEEWFPTGDTFEYEGVEYYMWDSLSNPGDSNSHILTTTINYFELYKLSCENNVNNRNYLLVMQDDTMIYDSKENSSKLLLKVE